MIGHWLDLTSLVRHTSGVTYARALELFRAQKVLDLGIEAGDAGDGNWLLEGQVQGSQRKPYVVSIDLTLDAYGRIE